MSRRHFRNGQATTLTAPVDGVSTSITVTSATSFPTQYPYTLILDPDGVLEEVVDVTAAVGTTLTIVRGVDGTTASPHSAGVQVYHGVSARDADEANDHVNKTTNIHGSNGALVDVASTQTITGAKDFSSITKSGSALVDVSSTQTITGTKTFSTRPIVTGNGDVVTTGGSQTIDGAKTWTGTETHQGAETHSGTETHSGAASFTNGLGVTGNVTVTSGRVIATDEIFTTTYSGTVDSNGFLTVTHGAGFTPTGVWAVTTNPSSSFALFWGVDSITSTQCRLRFMNASVAGPLNGLAVSGRLFLVRP